MAALDHQLGFVDEVTYGTGVTVTKFFEYDTESVDQQFARTEGDPLVSGQLVRKSTRFFPYSAGASGTISLAPMTKGFGYLLKHMLGTVNTTGPTETTVYSHTGTMSDLTGKFFSAQLNRPFTPSGTNQAFTFAGGKVTEFELKNSVDENLIVDLGVDFQSVTTATALATVSYPSGMENLTWAGGTLTIGGTQVDVTEFSLKVDNNQKTDRRYISGSTLKKEPLAGRRSIEFSLKADFDSLTQRNRVASTTASGALAQIIATWQGPTLLGSTLYPGLTVTLPAARFDEWKANAENSDGVIEQELSGVVEHDGTNAPITMLYKSADVTV